MAAQYQELTEAYHHVMGDQQRDEFNLQLITMRNSVARLESEESRFEGEVDCLLVLLRLLVLPKVSISS